jgi:signal peptidase I
MSPEVVVRRGSWAVFALGGLCLAAMFLNPVAGAALAAIFFALAAGIRRRQVWAATLASAAMIGPIVLTLANGQVRPALMVSIAMQAGIACLPVWATVTLWRHREMARFGKGWLAFAVLLVLAAIALHPYSVAAASMANTIDRGDYVLTESLSWKLGRTPHNGDVVQIRYPIDPRQMFVKRIVGVPGDRIRIVNKQLFRNGQAVAEPYALHSTNHMDPYRDNFPSEPDWTLPAPAMDMLRNHVSGGELVVPPGRYFVLGDNRDDSLDSRYWGFVTRSEIMASPLVIYASYDVPAQHPEVTGTIFNTRWNRLLKLL